MASDSNQANIRIGDMTGRACVELFSDYGVLLAPSPSALIAGSGEPEYFGVIGFVGPGVRGTCLLGAQRGLVAASCRTGNRPRDWIAELSNQLIGRVKLKLSSCGVTVGMTTPFALSGVRLTPLPRLGHEPLGFVGEPGAALVWLEVETASNFVLAEEQAPDIFPGDLIF